MEPCLIKPTARADQLCARGEEPVAFRQFDIGLDEMRDLWIARRAGFCDERVDALNRSSLELQRIGLGP